MARILRHPFGLAVNGNVATVDQDSDAADAQGVAVLVLTRRGERPLVPGYGIADPTFAGVDAGEVAAGVARYGPPVRIVNVTTTPAGPAAHRVTVTYS